jgi:hypothetical protein
VRQMLHDLGFGLVVKAGAADNQLPRRDYAA